MQKEGERYAGAWEFYEALKEKAGGGTKLDPGNLPDWTGIYVRTVGPYPFDPDQVDHHHGMPTAKLKPEYDKEVRERIEMSKKGIEHDPALGNCLPPGYPRWLTEPYSRELIVTPAQTWLINELANDVRRVYTDGRGHTDPLDRIPLFEGDSIGFWDGDRLVVHTNQVMAGIYQRLQPKHTENLETVEIWYRNGADTIVADVWVYDAEVLLVPWYTRQTFKKEPNEDKSIRLRYYDCVGAANTRVSKGADGATTFDNLDFDNDDKPSAGTVPAAGDNR